MLSGRGQLQIAKEDRGAVTIVAITGSIDAQSAPALAEFLDREIANARVNLVLDLAALNYTSSAGLRMILNAVKATRARGGDTRLAAVQPNVNKIFEMSGFHAIIQSFEDTARAVASFAG